MTFDEWYESQNIGRGDNMKIAMREAWDASTPDTRSLLLRCKVADLLHLMQHARVETCLRGEEKMIQEILIDLKRMLEAFP
jgi:hypothetical protein